MMWGLHQFTFQCNTNVQINVLFGQQIRRQQHLDVSEEKTYYFASFRYNSGTIFHGFCLCSFNLQCPSPFSPCRGETLSSGGFLGLLSRGRFSWWIKWECKSFGGHSMAQTSSLQRGRLSPLARSGSCGFEEFSFALCRSWPLCWTWFTAVMRRRRPCPSSPACSITCSRTCVTTGEPPSAPGVFPVSSF